GRPGGPGDVASGMQEGRPCIPAGRRCGVVIAGPLAEIPRDDPPAPVYRRIARQAAGGRRHRASFHLRVDHQDHIGSSVRMAAGEGARPDLYGLRRHAVPEGTFPDAGRAGLHRAHRGETRPHFQRRPGTPCVPAGVLFRGRAGMARGATIRRTRSARIRIRASGLSPRSADMGLTSSGETVGRGTPRRCRPVSHRPTSVWTRPSRC
ncbi:MAG: hypothetical protein H6Q82_2607, partial [Deltaproteobacteria bacterium]|nr:hypothetical protein [Deltaproteobacteria bacterium]